ncbi:MAG: pyridoxal-dependent decarboxylase, exosortase A system-associated [Halorhodospira sp.]
MIARVADLPCMRTFSVRDGCLALGGTPVTELVTQAGGTPVYLYDTTTLRARIGDLRRALPQAVELRYAIKANPMPAVLAYLLPYVDGFDIASTGELSRLQEAGAAPETISFAGPGKRDEELAAAIAAGVTLHLESAGELERIAAQADKQGTRPRVGVRINPDFELKASGMRMGGGPQPFGVDAESVPPILQRIDALDLDFQGFHVFAGSQNLHTGVLIDGLQRMLALIRELSEAAPSEVKRITLGAGLGIPYFRDDPPIDLDAYGQATAEAVARSHRDLPHARIALELGRYLVGEAGVYLARVIDRKISRGQTYLVTDGGMHHHLAASGNLGQVVRRNFPIAVANRMEAPPEETVSVVGPLCTPLDCLAGRIELPRAEPGDLIAIFQSGAYGPSASPVYFLSHPLPHEKLV